MVVDVVIPALNEALGIGLVLAELPACVREVVVADNGSTDGTDRVAQAAGARVVCAPRRGYGFACLAGLAVLREPEVVVFLDGDHSDYPGEMDSLLAPIAAGQADLVVGSRLRGALQPGAMPLHAYLGNKLLAGLVTWVTGSRVTDIGPFRAITWPGLKALNLCEGRYGWTLEMMLKAARRGYRMLEVPVSYRPRVGQSKVSGSLSGSLKAASVMLMTVARYGFA